MNKYSQEKRIYFSLVATKKSGKITLGSALRENQGIDGACHQINDVFLPGKAAQRVVWEDRDRTVPVEEEETPAFVPQQQVKQH